MRSLLQLRVASLSVAFLVACGGSDDDGGPDAGDDLGVDAGDEVDPDAAPPADAAPSDAGIGDASPPQDAQPPPDADVPEFDHFRFEFDPEQVRANIPFELEVTAYASEDDSEPLVDYEGPASVVASAGTLTGDTGAQAFEDGVATLTLEFAAPVDDVELTVTDDDDAAITGTTDPFDVLPEGDAGALRDVVINEVNWFGNGDSNVDVWIELRNTTEGDLNLAGWSIDDAGFGGDVEFESGTTIAAGGYLVVGNRQGDDIDGERTSLTGVDNVVVHTVSLRNTGNELILRDRDGEVVDRTPEPNDIEWPAGNPGVDFLMSMERRDDITGGGYGDGAVRGQWYTWNEADGSDTTHPDSRDVGTPGADNTDPTIPMPPDSLPYATSFEPGQRQLRLTSTTGAQVNDPPPGTDARSGSHVVSTDALTTSQLNVRRLQSASCIELRNNTDDLVVQVHAMASTDNAVGELRLRHVVEWYTDDQCQSRHPDGDGEERASNEALSQSYELIELVIPGDELPAGATHIRLSLEPAKDSGGADEGWAADDLVADQVEGELFGELDVAFD